MRASLARRSGAAGSLAAFLIAGSALAAADETLVAGVFEPPRIAPEFTLSGSDGRPLTLTSYRGKVVLLAFGYTSCTEVCPITLSILKLARQRLGSAAGDVQVVYVTVDPERDTAEHMRTFLTGFDPSFLGGTGSAAALAKVRADYGISVGKKLPFPGGYALSHSSFVYLIDRAGSLRALMPYGHTADDFAHDARILLKR